MQVRSSIKRRSEDAIIVKRQGILYVIDKKNPNNKMRMAGKKLKKNPKQRKG